MTANAHKDAPQSKVEVGKAERTVFLHVGMHKTGTSALQTALAGYDDGMIAYARFNEINHSLPIYTAFSTDPFSYRSWRERGLSRREVLALRDRYRARFAANLERRDRCGLIVVGEDIGKIDAAGQRDLIQFITERGWSLRAFCYLRPPESFIASGLQERIKGGLDHVPEQFEPNYRGRIEVFLQEIGAENLSVRLYDRDQLRNGSVIADFCDQLGIDPPRSYKQRPSNESLSLDAVRLIFALNRSNPCTVGDPALVEARGALCADLARLYPEGARLSPELFVGRVNRGDLTYLADTFGLALPSAPERADFALEEILSDLEAVDPEPLALRVKAPLAVANDRVWLVNRLFALHLWRADARRAPIPEVLSVVLRAVREKLRRSPKTK